MGGRPSSNCTSTTAPITATTRPFGAAAAAGAALAPAAAGVFPENEQKQTYHVLLEATCLTRAAKHCPLKIFCFLREDISLRHYNLFILSLIGH